MLCNEYADDLRNQNGDRIFRDLFTMYQSKNAMTLTLHSIWCSHITFHLRKYNGALWTEWTFQMEIEQEPWEKHILK